MIMRVYSWRFLMVVLAMASIAFAPIRAAGPANAIGSEARGEELIRELHLEVLPKESGYLGIVGSSAQKVAVDGKQLAVQSQVYYMLTEKLPINYLHWLAPDDTHVLI